MKIVAIDFKNSIKKFNEIANNANEKNKKNIPRIIFENPLSCFLKSNNTPIKKEIIIGKNRVNSIFIMFCNLKMYELLKSIHI